ncbi:MAG: nuclease domain-containing protein, partial [Candidatus Hadarchaeum sp.]
FVAFALRSLAAQSTSLEKLLRRQAERLRQKPSTPPKEAGEKALNLWRQGRDTARQAAEYLEELASRLAEARDWANEKLKHPILATCKNRARPPSAPSLRLTRSPGYGPVYAAYRRVSAPDSVELRLDAVRRGLAERAIKPTSELYELWLFLETYALLVEQFGFRPVDNQPVAHLELQAGRLKLERNQSYKLELRPENDPSTTYRVRMTYEPPVDYPPCTPQKSRCYLPEVCPTLPCYRPNGEHYSRGPDVVIETEHKGRTHRFALDAKYRDYDRQPLFQTDAIRWGLETNFDVDVLGTAKGKYLDGMGYDAAFVVHSDADSRFTYFGEGPFQTVPHRERTAKRLPAFAGHRYGAVYAAPGKTSKLELLVKCLLMYHAGWYDVCWTCRRRLLPETGEQWKPIGKVSTYFQCQYGHGFWAISHCAGSRHRLIKLGCDSFHRTKPDDVWHCECPECGGDLSSLHTAPPLTFYEPLPF